jgi:plastocyanin
MSRYFFAALGESPGEKQLSRRGWMRHRLRHGKRRRGTYAAAATLAGCGLVAGVGAAGAAQQAADTPVAVVDTRYEPADLPIDTGDTVTWNTSSQAVHNVEGENYTGPGGAAVAQAWNDYKTPLASSGSQSYTFVQPGTYTYYCLVHPEQMRGTIVVTGDPVEPTPTPTPTATATASPTVTPTVTPTATPTPTPTASGGTSTSSSGSTTPAPANIAGSDRTAPALSGLSLKAIRRGARVRFKLSEPATVTLSVKKRGTSKVVRSMRLQARPGTRTVTVRSARLTPGRYTVELRARDATGNSSSLLRSNLRIRRK